MSTSQPLSSLGTTGSSFNVGGSCGMFILWFVIIAVIAWLILYAIKPSVVQKVNAQNVHTGEPDPLKVLVGAILIAIIIVIIIWLFRSAYYKQ